MHADVQELKGDALDACTDGSKRVLGFNFRTFAARPPADKDFGFPRF